MSAFEGKADIESPPKFFQGPEDGWVPTFARDKTQPFPETEASPTVRRYHFSGKILIRPVASFVDRTVCIFLNH